jgi:hypothetical protein
LFAQEFEELDVVEVWHPIEPVDQLIDHVGEGLDESDTGVSNVVVRPLRAATLNQALGFIDEVLECPVIKVWCGQGHDSSSCGMT